MTNEGPQTEPTPSTGLASSIESTAAELWNEVLQHLDEVQSVAPSSAEQWDEVLQRLSEVREAHTKLATAVDHLSALLSNALVTERQRDLARRGIAADLEPDGDVPPLQVPASSDLEARESPNLEARDPSEEIPLLAEQTVTGTLLTPEERETYEPEALDASPEGEHPWMTESVGVPPVGGSETEEEAPWLADVGATEAPEGTAEGSAQTSEALAETARDSGETAQDPAQTASVEVPDGAAFQTPQVVDALLAAEFGDAAVRIMDPEDLTLDAFLAQEFAPAEPGDQVPPENPPPPTPADLPPRSSDSPFLAEESTLPIEPPPIPEPLAAVDATEPEADLDPLPLLSDSPSLAEESTLPIEPPPIPEPLAAVASDGWGEPSQIRESLKTPDANNLEGTVTEVGPVEEATTPEADLDPPPPSFASMTSEILEAAPEDAQPVADVPPEEENTHVQQDQLRPNTVSEDFTIIGKRRNHLHLRLN